MKDSPVILITGASSGIGEETARLFASLGYAVVLAARRFERLQALAAEIEAGGGEALPVATDVSRLGDINNLVESSLDRFGQVDVLLNNAGFGRMRWLEELDAQQEVARQIQVNLTGAVWVAQAVLPHMINRRRGHIINMASVASWIATPTYSIYAASKFGLRGFTEALRREVSTYGVQVSGIYPGGVDTGFRRKTGQQRKTGVTTPRWLRLEASDVAREVWRVVQKPRRTIVIPRLMWLPVWVNILFPGLVDRAIDRYFVRRERL